MMLHWQIGILQQPIVIQYPKEKALIDGRLFFLPLWALGNSLRGERWESQLKC